MNSINSIFLDNKSPIIFGDGNQTRDFIYVKDIAEVNLLALSSGDNETFNISTQKPVRVNELFEVMKKILNSKLEPIHEEERDGDIRYSHLKNEKAHNILNWNIEYI